MKWTIPIVNQDHPKGRLDLEVPQWDNSGDFKWLYPITVSFVGRTTYAALNVCLLPVRSLSFQVEGVQTIGGDPLGYRFNKEMIVQKYIVGEVSQ